MEPVKISASILNADFLKLGEQIEMINNSQADWLHLDVMDGVFVPNISFGLTVLEAASRVSKKPVDVHLMIVEPEKYVGKFAEKGANMITVHYEACTHLHSVIQQIKSFKCKAGVALNPHTEVSLLRTILPDLDMVLIMTVNPGFGGQQFIKGSLKRIMELNRMKSELNPGLIIQVDGGITLQNIQELKQAGANCMVVGTTIFKAPDPLHMISLLKS